jgi:hypothetical protein
VDEVLVRQCTKTRLLDPPNKRLPSFVLAQSSLGLKLDNGWRVSGGLGGVGWFAPRKALLEKALGSDGVVDRK